MSGSAKSSSSTPQSSSSHHKPRHCTRLYAFDGQTTSKVSRSAEPSHEITITNVGHVLATNKVATDGPYRAVRRHHLPNAGPVLDFAPYWDAELGVGGWAISTGTYYPTPEELQQIAQQYVNDLPVSGTFRLYIHVRHREGRKKPYSIKGIWVKKTG